MFNQRFIKACLPALIVLAAQMANAASGDGPIVGHINAENQSAVSGAEITAKNPATGFSRTVKADARRPPPLRSKNVVSGPSCSYASASSTCVFVSSSNRTSNPM